MVILFVDDGRPSERASKLTNLGRSRLVVAVSFVLSIETWLESKQYDTIR